MVPLEVTDFSTAEKKIITSHNSIMYLNVYLTYFKHISIFLYFHYKGNKYTGSERRYFYRSFLQLEHTLLLHKIGNIKTKGLRVTKNENYK